MKTISFCRFHWQSVCSLLGIFGLSFCSFFFSVNAQALIITDVIEFRQQLSGAQSETYYDFIHDFTDDGFRPGVDRIMGATLTMEFVETGDGIDDPPGDSLPDNWESIIVLSEIFDRRSYMPDMDTGVYRAAGNYWMEEFSRTGITRTSLGSYTDNLWLGDVVMQINVERGAPIAVPESGSGILLLLGLGALALKSRRRFFDFTA